jgi:hypothetical protein
MVLRIFNSDPDRPAADHPREVRNVEREKPHVGEIVRGVMYDAARDIGLRSSGEPAWKAPNPAHKVSRLPRGFGSGTAQRSAAKVSQMEIVGKMHNNTIGYGAMQKLAPASVIA